MTEPVTRPPPDLTSILRQRGSRRQRLALAAVITAALALGLLWHRVYGGAGDRVQFVSEAVGRGDLRVLVTATGALQPTNQVEVGTEVSGTIEAVLVRVNDQVEAGQVLARLDTARLGSTVAQVRAAVASARARLAETEATAEEARQRLARLERVRELSDGRSPSADELSTARAVAARAETGIATAQAAIAEAEARLASETTNLEKAIIRAPIDGIVLVRQVETGQTVAASLQTPVLFTLAQTLAQMELRVAIDEADVGQIRPGQQATFVVDAFPGRRFPATIETVHFAPTLSAEGVVTYKAELSLANDELLLRPGMTATADIVVDQRSRVLRVPNAALRFEPPDSGDARGSEFSLVPATPRFARRGGGAQGGRGNRVWVLEAGVPRAVSVTTGANDGFHTEVVAGELREGDQVILDYRLNAAGR